MANKHLRDVIQELENIIANSNAPVSSRVMQTLQRLKHASNVSLQSSAQTLISNGDIQALGDQLISAATALPNENDLARIDSDRAILQALHNQLMGHLSQGRTLKAPKTMDVYNRLVKREMRAGVTTANFTATPSASGYTQDPRYNKNNVQARTAAQANTFAYKRQRAVLAALKRYTPGTPQYRMIAEAAGQDIRKGIDDRKIADFQNTHKMAFKVGKLDLNHFKKDKLSNFDEIRETYGNMKNIANVYGSRARGAAQHQTHLKMIRDLQDFEKQFGDVLNARNKQAYQNSFQQQQQKSQKKKERNDFINQILTGIKQIFGKNALGDMIKWLILLFGKNHPVLASILLTLPTVIGTFKALSNVIRGLIGTIRSIGGVLGKIFTALSVFAGGGAGALAMMIGGSKGGLVRNAVAGASRLSRGSSVLFGANSFIGKNILQPFANMGMRVSALKNASGVGAKNLGQIISGGSKVTKGIPIVGSLLSFGGHMLAGDGMGKSLAHTAGGAGGSALGGIIGAAIGSIIPGLGTAIGGVIGTVIGGLLGDWIGGALFDKLNKQDESLKSIKENTSWLGRIWEWVKDKFGGDSEDDGTYKPSGSTYGNTVHTDANQVMTMTPEQKKKAEEVYKYDAELYDRAINDKKRFSFGRGGFRSAKDDLMDKWLAEYANNKLGVSNGANLWAPGSAAQQKYERDKAILMASPEAKAYGDSMYEKYLATEGDRLKKLREKLDNTTIVNGTNSTIPPRSYKVSNTQGIPTVSLKDMGLQNGSLKYGSGLNTMINANAAGAMEDLDKLAGQYGVRYKVTSTMGDGHNKSKNGWGHGDGYKIDIVPENGGKRDAKWMAFEEALRRQKYWSTKGAGTGAIGWHNAGSGYHDDLSLARGVIPKTGKTAIVAGYNEMKKASEEAVQVATQTQTQSLQLASNGLRTALNERTGGGKPGDTENQRLERTRRMIFSATDVTGSMGVWGITHLNNHGGMYVGGKGGR